jgi:pimeloyl-ACP methyl ester carboxylesterase
MENTEKSRNLIYFKVKYNHARQVEDATANEITDHPDIRECECVLCLPDSYSENGDPTPLIMSFHGAGSRVCEADGKVGGVKYVYDCVDNGYAALDVCGSEPHGLTMGCPEHIYAMYKAYRYAVKNYDLTERVLLYGGSMGGQTSINFACTYPSICLALGEYFPRMNIQTFTTADGHVCLGTWDKTTPNKSGISTRDRTAENFHLENGEWNYDNIAGFEPYNNRSFTNEKGEKVVIPPCPIKIWHGTADTVVDHVVSVEYIKAVRRGGCYGELRLIEGIGHQIIPAMQTELRMWFDRFI